MTIGIGDGVFAKNHVFVSNDQVAARQGETGVVTSIGVGSNVEVQWDRTHILTVIHTAQITKIAEHPDSEPGDDFHKDAGNQPPVMGWFAALAEENVLRARPSEAVEVAQVYAILELAAAIDRSQ